jgi:polyisoprenoid-binding protein YceI
VTDFSGTIDLGPNDGRVLVKTGREGLAAKAGHDLTIEITRWRARVGVPDSGDISAATVAVELDLSSLAVREGTGGAKPLSDKDKADIQAQAAKILGAPTTATFVSAVVSAQPGGPAVAVDGTLTLNGTPGPLRLQVVNTAPGEYRGTATIRQTAHGITPYSGFLGALKLKDEIGVEFQVALK